MQEFSWTAVMISDAQLTPDWRNEFGWKRRGGVAVAPLSARQLAASLWRLGGGSVRGLSFDRLGFQLSASGEVFECRKHVNEEGWSRMRYGMNMMNESMRAEQQMKKLAEGIKSERKICKNMEKMNSKMGRDVAEAKLSARKLKWNLEKEKKARKELEGVCYDLAKEIKGRKAEIEEEKQRRIREEVEEERRMREVAEVWREENLILEDKYAEINEAMANLRTFHFHADVGVKDLNKALALLKDSKKSKGKNINEEAAGRCKTKTILIRRNPHVVRGMKGDIHEWPTLRLAKYLIILFACIKPYI